jgi:hypothetical protein
LRIHASSSDLKGCEDVGTHDSPINAGTNGHEADAGRCILTWAQRLLGPEVTEAIAGQTVTEWFVYKIKNPKKILKTDHARACRCKKSPRKNMEQAVLT